MSALMSLTTPAAAQASANTLPTGAWSVLEALENGAAFVKEAGGGVLILMGLVALVWGGVLALKKLMAGQGNQTSWGTIILLIILGGAIAVGGFALIFEIGSGGKQTIEDIGGGTLLFNPIAPMTAALGLGF